MPLPEQGFHFTSLGLACAETLGPRAANLRQGRQAAAGLTGGSEPEPVTAGGSEPVTAALRYILI